MERPRLDYQEEIRDPWFSEVEVRGQAQVFLRLLPAFLGPLHHPESWVSRPVSFKALSPSPTHPLLRLQRLFYTVSGNPDSGHDACKARTLLSYLDSIKFEKQEC